ncbi:MAG: hypothetical protein ACYTF7_12010 [Planctomycetota bacterium]|jgi:uncharacterized protein (DUF983 family)
MEFIEGAWWLTLDIAWGIIRMFLLMGLSMVVMSLAMIMVKGIAVAAQWAYDALHKTHKEEPDEALI